MFRKSPEKPGVFSPIFTMGLSAFQVLPTNQSLGLPMDLFSRIKGMEEVNTSKNYGTFIYKRNRSKKRHDFLGK